MVKKKGFPKWNENVLCTVTRITPFAAWCILDEYENEDGSRIEGMIHISQVAGKWVKDIRKFVKPNKQYIAKVIRIDREKGHINLSLKRVSKVDKREKLDTYRRNKRASGMLTQAAKKLGETMVNAEKEVVSKLKDDYDDLFSAFEDASTNPDVLKEAEISKKWRDALLEIIERNFQTKERKIKADLKLSSTAGDGINSIKKTLAALEKKSGATVKYISAPNYLIELTTDDPKEGEKKLKEALEETVKGIQKVDGTGEYEFIR